MNREIKFRGKSKSTGELVYGFGCYTNTSDRFFILIDKDTSSIDYVEVESIQQYTGLKDKNGKEIYEGDLCNDGSRVVFSGGRFLLSYVDGEWEDLIGDNDEVIGNIYESITM